VGAEPDAAIPHLQPTKANPALLTRQQEKPPTEAELDALIDAQETPEVIRDL
jgi:hypothetical protein